MAFHHSFFGSCMGERWGGPGNEPSSCIWEKGDLGMSPAHVWERGGGGGGPGNEPSSCIWEKGDLGMSPAHVYGRRGTWE